MKRIAFFGGSFDPPHRGHLAIAKAAADRFALDEILFAPVATQPLKEQLATSFFHRYAMTVLATQSDSRFVPTLLDAPSGQPNYTVETLARLGSSLPSDTELFTLLGADSWLQIARWHDAIRLLAMSDWIVATRPGFSLANAGQALPPGVAAESRQNESGAFLELHHNAARPTRVFFLLDMDEEISATELRSTLDASHPDPNLVPAAVREYIRKTGLYRS